MKTDICPQCGQEFSYYPSGYKNGVKKYCSRECYSAARRIWTTCPQCGKEFWYHKSWPRIYCSRKCSAAVNAQANLGDYAINNPPVEVSCDNCGKYFLKRADQVEKTSNNFCSQRCFGDYLSKTQKGKPRPEVSGEKPHLQKRIELECRQCGKVFSTKESHATRRKFCSKECMAKWQSESGEMSGQNNFNYKGGYKRYYGSDWRPQRRKARKRDNYTCQRCGITEVEMGHALDVHHIIPFRIFGIERYREANHLDNLISLCKTCHTTVEHETNDNI